MPQQNSEQQFPQRPLHGNGKSRPHISQQSDDYEDEYDDNEAQFSPPPANGLLYALLAGLIAGALTVLLNIAFTFLNTGTFQQAAKEITANQLSTNVAYIIAALGCLNLLIGIAIALAVGYIIGKMAIQRRLGFYAGAIVGLIVYLGSFLVRYIPNYPGNLPSSTGGATGAATGLLISLLFLCIWGLIGGLLGYLGARIATRHHPYYTEATE